MKKKILLVEPGYKTKYPPLGLMKISTYHRKIKDDDVVFVKGCSSAVRDEYWDRVYISTLFTYTWHETVKTINYYVDTLFNFSRKIYVGGILANLMPDDLFNISGIQPVIGLLNDPKKVDQDDNIIIDELPPDYEILKQVDFKYNYTDAYLGYTTRGCVRNCDFCAVKTLEPEYVPYVDINKLIKEVASMYGEKQNLLLMDNNVLASKHFDKIIDDIKSAGFIKGATFGKTRRKRIVDFNQGLDGRLLTEEKMRRLSEIPLEPMRIAFDHIKYKDTYVKAVRLAHKYGQKDMSNYILYNHNTDTPDDFYERLRINIDLNEEFEKEHSQGKGARTIIYSFPMRYIPLDAKKRDVETGDANWNKRYLRGLQVILNVIKGPVMPGKNFFEQAFGADAEEFKAVLLMPDEFIRNRVKPNWRKIDDRIKRLMPYTRDWMKAYRDLTEEEKRELQENISSNKLEDIQHAIGNSTSTRVKKLLKQHVDADKIVSRYKNG
jgi:hypothetical protein